MKATVNNATAFEVSSNINSKTVVLNNQSLPLDHLQNGANLHFVWKGKSVNVEVISLSKAFAANYKGSEDLWDYLI
jgi:hypothetical protein